MFIQDEQSEQRQFDRFGNALSRTYRVLSVYFEGHRAEPLTGLLQRAPEGQPTRTPHP
jgi:hypothetical protein